MSPPAPDPIAQEFVPFALRAGVLRFGEFSTKAGRLSPYFFNAGGFDDGAKLGTLATFYSRRLLQARADGRLAFDMLFGPAYKGITLASAVAVEMARAGYNLPTPTTAKKPRTTARVARWSAHPCAGACSSSTTSSRPARRCASPSP